MHTTKQVKKIKDEFVTAHDKKVSSYKRILAGYRAKLSSLLSPIKERIAPTIEAKIEKYETKIGELKAQKEYVDKLDNKEFEEQYLDQNKGVKDSKTSEKPKKVKKETAKKKIKSKK